MLVVLIRAGELQQIRGKCLGFLPPHLQTVQKSLRNFRCCCTARIGTAALRCGAVSSILSFLLFSQDRRGHLCESSPGAREVLGRENVQPHNFCRTTEICTSAQRKFVRALESVRDYNNLNLVNKVSRVPSYFWYDNIQLYSSTSSSGVPRTRAGGHVTPVSLS